MKKALLIGIIICLGFTTIYSQQIEQKNIKGVVYIKQKGNWVIKSAKSDKVFLVNEEVISLKLKGDRSITKERIIRKNVLGYMDIQVPKGMDIMDYYDKLKEEYGQEIESIDINYYAELGFSPNDTQLNNQWYLDRIYAKQAWDITLGRPSVTVAVIDYCFNWAHDDIGRGTGTYENVWLNSGEDRWTNLNNPTTGNGIDDDSNSFIDDLKGWDFRNNDNDVRGIVDHGTRVSGIIGAKTNNQRGMAGMAGGNNSEGIKIMGLNVGYGASYIDMAVVDDAIIYAVDNGARVINMSFGAEYEVPAVNDAIYYAVQNNVVVIACSMNYSYNYVYYPASNPNVIAAGGTDKNNRRASFAQYGQDLDVVAPAVDIYSTTLNNGYNSQDGTSFAAPQVSGIAALMLSVRPDLTGQQVRNIIEQTAQKVGGYSYSNTPGRPNGTWHEQMGYGLVNAYAAVYAVAPRISGPELICSSGASFTVNNLPTGATITWSQGPKLTRTSAQGANPCTFSSTGSGSSWIRATVVIGGNTITLPDKVVWLGIPQVYTYGNHIVDIQTGMPKSDFCYGRANEAKAVHLAGEAHISDWDWRVSYGQVFPYGSNDQYATIYPNSYQDFMLEIKAGNACGYSGWARMYTNVVDCRSYHLVFTPNPTIGETILSIESDSKEEAFDENAEWEMEIYSQSLLLMKKKTRQYGQSTRIQTADWKEGVYIVRVLYKGEVLTGKLMVTK